jgi:ubiquitin carboxyl-terminal hydrolase L5
MALIPVRTGTRYSNHIHIVVFILYDVVLTGTSSSLYHLLSSTVSRYSINHKLSVTTMSNDWCTIESDPGVFTEMLSTLGCDTVELEELWSLDDDSLKALQETTGKVYGLIFLFKWVGKTQQEHAHSKKPLESDNIPPNLFFAHQVTTNACATQAILSVVLNAGLPAETLGNTLSEFQSFTSSFPPSLKGEAVASSQEIKTAHNAFGRQDAFLQEGKVHAPSESDEAFHFVAYIPMNNAVYELDGLQTGPIVVGSYNDTDSTADSAAETDADSQWLSIARAAIQERMIAGGDHVKFNLMAVIQDKRVKLQEDLLASQAAGDEQLIASLLCQADAQTVKREQWKVENQRRRHNSVPLCMALLKELAAAGSLPVLVKEAQERDQVKRQKRLAENNKK